MIHSPAGLWAQVISTPKLELTRLSMMTEWWHWLLLAGVSIVVPVIVIWMYIRDTRELPTAVALALAGLRVFALVGLLFTFLGFEQRTEQKVVQNSRVVLLIDASQSMGLQDTDSSSVPGADRRIDLVMHELAEGTMLRRLREKHDVVVMRFDESEQPIELASYSKLSNEQPAEVDTAATAAEGIPAMLKQARVLFVIAAGLMFLAVPMTLWYTFSRDATAFAPSLALLGGVCLLAIGAVLAAVTNLTHLDISLAAVVGAEDENDLKERLAAQAAEDSPQPKTAPEAAVDWSEALTPGGNETRLGEALMTVINRQRGGPVAGIVLVSDGRSNAGLPYDDAVLLADEAQVSIYTVGMGSNRRPTNVELVDIEAPARAYPGDRFTITGFVQAFGMDGRSVDVKLYSYPQGDDPTTLSPTAYDEMQSIDLSASGILQPVKFEVEPGDEPGKRVFVMQIEPPSGERNITDNRREVVVQIVERRTRVLLLAGGPTREYRFLRNQLYRDNETIVDVYLQSARPGVSQEADEILTEFPDNADDLFRYDCVVAFDPDWQAIDEGSIQLLEEWVSRQAGGLLVVAGPVFTPKWAGKRRGDVAIELLKGLYPVQFYNWGTSQGLGRFGAEKTSRLEFTRAGLESEFLWLGESAGESQHAWAGFEGVYGYYAVKDVKPGATIYAHFVNDEESTGPDDMPVFMAAHYYGAGRVFFLGSGEMWRIRQLDPAYFETFYTKLIRNVAAGRLLRDSKRGVLIVERTRYKVGDSVNIQARLTDGQHRPLSAEESPQVDAIVAWPDGRQVTVPLRNVNLGGEAIAGREGMYAGQFTALQLGDYNVQLTVPGTSGEEVLTQQIVVRAPRKEIERPERNDALLVDLADRTGGHYFNGIKEAAGRDANLSSLADHLRPHDRLTPLPEVPNVRFDRQLMTWLLALVAGALCLEWFVRRVSKLA